MSIITVIDQSTDNVACIDSDNFTTTIAPWFGDNADTLDASIREQFLDLAEIIESGQAFTDEEAGELCRFLGLTIESGTVNAELDPSNGTGFLDSDGEFHVTDTVIVTSPSGEEIARVFPESSEDPEPYDQALLDAGIAHFTWIL